jgi:hypothetical protein
VAIDQCDAQWIAERRGQPAGLGEALEDRVGTTERKKRRPELEPDVELLRSANSTVTCFRSPSRALLEVRIFSARCLGVYDWGEVNSDAPSRDAGGAPVTRVPHLPQKANPSGFA